MELKCPHCETVFSEPEQLGENRKSWGSGRETCKACNKEFSWKRKVVVLYESAKVEEIQEPKDVSGQLIIEEKSK